MKLNWFSPLPPARTAIAEYTAEIIPHLCDIGEVTLWTDQATWDKDLEKIAKVRHFSPDDIAGETIDGTINVYNIGNDARFHGRIWQASRRRPGIAILHDVNLHAFFAELYISHWHDLEGYLTQMEFYYGPEGRRRGNVYYRQAVKGNAAQFIDAMTADFPLTELGVENALGVLVHTQEMRKRLAAMLPVPVAYAPLPFSADRIDPEHSAEHSDDKKLRLVCFGHMSRNRCLDKVLLALATLSSREAFRLDIYGEVWDETYLRSMIDKLNLSKLVKLHGYVCESKLDKALRKADLAINLRWPSMGEASASQLRIWAHRLPSLVSKTAWYSTLDPDSVWFVHPRHEVKGIQEALLALLDDRDRFRRMGSKGRSVLEKEHSPAAFIRSLEELLIHIHDARPITIEPTAHPEASERTVIRKMKHIPGRPSTIRNFFATRGRRVAKGLLSTKNRSNGQSPSKTSSAKKATHYGSALFDEAIAAKPPASCHLDELLQYEGTTFVENAYRTVLRREPTKKEILREVDRLHTGHFDKIDLIFELRWSPEGCEANTQIDKLAVSGGLRSVYRIPLIGGAVRLAVQLLRIPVAQRRQRQFETYAAIRIQKQEEQITELMRRLDELAEKTHKNDSGKG